jgi:Ran GTPase-activating protein (RanGAP) involved in mRNA processing and transport
MRLFLHGRSDPSATVQRIRSHIDQQQQNLSENDSLSSIASASDEGAILLSGFDLDLHSDVCEALVDLFSSTSSWSEIKLQNCQGKEGFSRVISAILQTASVSRLILLHTNHQQSNRLSCPAAQALCQGLAQSSCRVQSLTLKGLCVPEASMTKIARALGQPSCTLSEFAVKGSFTSKEMDRGASCLEKGAMTCLIEALKRNTNLQVLDLEGANLSDTSLSLLVMALMNHPNLSTLSLRGNASAEKTIQALAYILSQQRKLEGTLAKLDLSAQRSSFETHDDDEEHEEVSGLEWEPLFLALQSNPPTLQQLILSDNHLNSNDTFDLAMALCVNTHLTELQLSNCCISDRGLVALADNLSGFTGLMKLRIDGEQQTFAKKSVRRLVRNLAYNFQLESLELPIGLGKSRTMQLYLNLNRAGRKHLIPQGLLREEDDEVYDTEDEEENDDDSHHGESTDAKTTRTGTPHCALWPKILQRADTIARRYAESAQKGDEASADVVYHLLCSGFWFHS